MSFAEILSWTEKLIALAIIQQSCEQLFLNQAFSARGGWRWSTLGKEFPEMASFVFSKLVPHPIFNLLRILAALGLFISPNCAFSLFLLLTQLLLLSRWRGNFNGGSDHMTVILLATLSLAHLFPNSRVAEGAILYLGLQSIFSYFIGGWVKVKKSNWRQGKALPVFISLSSYQVSPKIKNLMIQSSLVLGFSWFAMLFEISAPLALFFPSYLICFLAMGVCFHLTNFYLLGLNRFVFVWLATYPAIIFTAHFMSL